MTKFRGGKELEKLAKKAKRKPISYSVGIFPYAKYNDANNTQAAMVALWNEFGTRREDGSVAIPERPFFRSTKKPFQKELRKLTIKLRNPKTKLIDRSAVAQIAGRHVFVIKAKLIDIKSPPNSPVTIELKGSNNPLVDTGLLQTHITWAFN